MFVLVCSWTFRLSEMTSDGLNKPDDENRGRFGFKGGGVLHFCFISLFPSII